MSCSFCKKRWWCVMGIDEEDGCVGSSVSAPFSVFFLLNWKNCCITSTHSADNTPLLIFMFGWNGCTGSCGLSGPFPSSPSVNSQQKKPRRRDLRLYIFKISFVRSLSPQPLASPRLFLSLPLLETTQPWHTIVISIKLSDE